MTNRTCIRAAQAFGFALTLTCSSLSAQEKVAKPDPNLEAAKRPLSILESASWKDLFDGKDLTGWQGDTTGYIVKDGILVCQKGAKNLETEKEYSDFAFTFDFKLEASGNHGIGIRVPKGGHAAHDGMEIQILDHDGAKYSAEAQIDGKPRMLSWLKPWQVHGSIYGIYPAKKGYLKPVGEWNTQTIVAIEDHIMVILNGAVIVDAFLDDLTPMEEAFSGKDRRSGHITLSGHSDYVEFRNLKVAEFTPSPALIEGGTDNTPPAGFDALFTGKDLTGWKGLAHKNAVERRALAGDALKEAQTKADESMNAHWRAQDGVLTYDGLGDSLCTAKDYGDFEFYCDWKIPAGADSGIYLRGTPQIQIWDPWKPQKKEETTPSTPQEWVELYKTGVNLGSGGLWNNKRARNAPLVLADKPAGEWNSFLIRMVGKKVTIWLNGKLVVDRTELENYWDKTGLVPLVRADQIELQHHGSELFFKNLYIRELPY